jgi:hypothetical protein
VGDLSRKVNRIAHNIETLSFSNVERP